MAADLLVLVKHARPEVDPSVPAASWELGVEGLAGALRLAERLRPLGLGLVVSSVEPKAAETGRLVAEALDLAWQTGHDLHEHVRPSVGYLAQEEFEASIRRFFSTPASVVFGDESADAAHRRFSAAIDALVRVHRGRRLCVVAHGTVLSLLLGRRYGLDEWATWKALGTPSYVVVDRRTRSVVEVVREV
jgi:broad specificity phosphatase PhoE